MRWTAPACSPVIAARAACSSLTVHIVHGRGMCFVELVYEYRIRLIRCHGYYLFCSLILYRFYSKAATIQERRLYFAQSILSLT